MEAEQEQQTESSRPGGTGPGEQLQAARIRKGLALEDVANRMHLSTAILEAIENNNFEEITAPIFVKGYLRAYARIVSLNEDDMIRQYLELYSEEDPPIHSTSNLAPELSSNDTRIKWTTYLVILLLAVLLGAWWWNKQQNLEPPVSLDLQPPSTSSSEAGATADADTVTAEVVVDAPAEDAAQDDAVEVEAATSSEAASDMAESEPEAADAGPAAEAIAEQAAVAAPTPVTEAAVVEAPVVVAGEGEAPAALTRPVVEEVAAAPEAGTRERPGRAAPVGDDRLRIIVHADTWADVKDSNNYQLEYNLLRAGSTLDFTGQAPFSVFLGNGHGVEVLFNGEEIGFTARIRDDNTARLNIGG